MNGKLRMRLADLAAVPVPADVRRAGPADAAAIAGILAAAFADARWTVELVRKVLLEADDVVAVWLAPASGEAHATASSRLLPERFPGSGYLHWVGTRPGRQGGGLGRAVSLAALAELRARGCRDAVLETDDGRRAAIALYVGLGFRPECCAEGHRARWDAILEAVR